MHAYTTTSWARLFFSGFSFCTPYCRNLSLGNHCPEILFNAVLCDSNTVNRIGRTFLYHDWHRVVAFLGASHVLSFFPHPLKCLPVPSFRYGFNRLSSGACRFLAILCPFSRISGSFVYFLSIHRLRPISLQTLLSIHHLFIDIASHILFTFLLLLFY